MKRHADFSPGCSCLWNQKIPTCTVNMWCHAINCSSVVRKVKLMRLDRIKTPGSLLCMVTCACGDHFEKIKYGCGKRDILVIWVFLAHTPAPFGFTSVPLSGAVAVTDSVRAQWVDLMWLLGGACWSDLTGRVSAVDLESTINVCVCLTGLQQDTVFWYVLLPHVSHYCRQFVHVNDSKDKAFHLVYNPWAVCILSILAAAGDLIHLYIISSDLCHFPLNNCSGLG